MSKNNLPAKTTISQKDVTPLFEQSLMSVRTDMRDNPYIIEAIKVLQVEGYRSAIGNLWNAVVDDLRNKIMFRSLSMFNKSVQLGREIKTYEDFQNYVNDDQLIEGAYKIGVIGWEASKILKHAKETRHIFDGHPKSSTPSVVKVLAMMDDCIKYVLNEEYPAQIIDVDEYMTVLTSTTFDRNTIAIENALGDLPEVYKNELANKLYTAYIHPQSSSVLRANIEFILPILWQVLPKEVKIQIVRRVDQEISKGDSARTEMAFAFVINANAIQYLSTVARKYKLKPLIDNLAKSLDDFGAENAAVKELEPYAAVIPPELLESYVSSLTQTYVGHMGSSAQWSRTDFFANEAASRIPKMFEAFDDRAAQAFIQTLKSNEILRRRIRVPTKLRRLRSLGNIVIDRISQSFSDKAILKALVDENTEEKFFKLIG